MMNINSNQAWSVWFSTFLLIASVALFMDAGSASYSRGELGSGFLPKIVAASLFFLSAFNIVTAVRATSQRQWLPPGYAMALVVLLIGLLSIVAFRQLGMVSALLFQFFVLFSLFERKLSVKNLLISIAVTFAIHGFFVGALGVFEPAGRLIDLRWIAPW
jgi:hypothetical protein